MVSRLSLGVPYPPVHLVRALMTFTQSSGLQYQLDPAISQSCLIGQCCTVAWSGFNLFTSALSWRSHQLHTHAHFIRSIVELFHIHLAVAGRL